MSMFEELDDDRGARAAKNQALFREVNERVMGLKEGSLLSLPIADWICECADETCSERISLTPEQYEQVRAAGDRFAVAPGYDHVVPDVESVVERHDAYWVVEKFGFAGELAEGLNPRARKRVGS
jgi:hypothetical protein